MYISVGQRGFQPGIQASHRGPGIVPKGRGKSQFIADPVHGLGQPFPEGAFLQLSRKAFILPDGQLKWLQRQRPAAPSMIILLFSHLLTI